MITNSFQFILELPEWLKDILSENRRSYPAIEDRMRFVTDLSVKNIRSGTGGPFGAAVFTIGTGELFAAGVNLVTFSNCSVAHAEIVAIMMAQQRAGAYDLGNGRLPPLELVSSAEPCAMCFGAIPWSGVRRLVCGARTEDVERIGFDEGEKPENWAELLEKRNITVIRDICRNSAADVIRQYKNNNGVIY